MVRKLFSSVFGSVFYDSKVVPAATVFPVGETWDTGATIQINKRDDTFYLDATGAPDNQAGLAITYSKHDLRDLLEEGECLSDVAIGVQRFRETPLPVQIYNMPAIGGNIEEMILITNSKIDTQETALDGTFMSMRLAGFEPLNVGSVGNLAYRNANKLDDMREIIYCERRVYGQDTSQMATSPNEVGGQGGSSPTAPPSRYCNNLLLLDRTVTGEADLIVGPDITIIRWFRIIGRDRGVTNVYTAPGVTSNEFAFCDMRIMVEFPPLKISMMGDKRKLTETEKAIEYTNVLLSNQNLIDNP